MIRTLSGRLTLYSVVSFAVLLLICFSLLYWSISSLLMQRLDQDLQEDLSELALVLDQDGVAELIREIDKETAGTEYETVVMVLLDAAMNTLHHTTMSAWSELQLDLPLARARLRSGSEPVVLTTKLDSQEAPTRIIYGALSPDYVLVLGESTEEILDITELLISAFSIMFLLAVPVAAVLGWAVTRRTVAGIEKVGIAARGISEGDLNVRVNADNELEEVQTLADTFDAMAGRIQTLIHHMREMTDNISHDLRSPLGRIRLLSESLLHKHADVGEMQENVVHTITECDRLIQMINLSLDVAEAEAGMLTLQTSEIDLSALIQETCDFYEPAIELKQISLTRNIEPRCYIMADGNSLQRLLSNLLDNSLKYTPEKGEIAISVHCNGEYTDVSVCDNGVGIQAESLDHVFDRFYRADTSRGGKGCGLGLSYAQAVAKAHGGQLTVQSSPGIRTIFTLRLHSISVGPLQLKTEMGQTQWSLS
ncbi:MAG: HAMP domain-containing protein [Granulosicoccus sp.]|nr:HAMP domain-containing protein [Granulosicoccus sp.]